MHPRPEASNELPLLLSLKNRGDDPYARGTARPGLDHLHGKDLILVSNVVLHQRPSIGTGIWRGRGIGGGRLDHGKGLREAFRRECLVEGLGRVEIERVIRVAVARSSLYLRYLRLWARHHADVHADDGGERRSAGKRG
jgi:hypothetical protein